MNAYAQSLWLGLASVLAVNGCSAQISVRPVGEPGRMVGFAVRENGRPLVVVHLGPRGLISAAEVGEEPGRLTLSGLALPEAVGRLGRGSTVVVEWPAGQKWPLVRFDLRLESFNPEAWQKAVGQPAPFFFLPCVQQGATMIYVGGALIPTPEVDPFPLSAKGYMAGEWADGWTHAAALGGWAVPAVGLWDHKSGAFRCYDFTLARHRDRAANGLAVAACLGLPQNAEDSGRAVSSSFIIHHSSFPEEAPFFCLVWPYQAQWTQLRYPKAPVRIAARFELIWTDEIPARRDPNQFVLQRIWNEHRDLLPPAPRMNDLGWIPDRDSLHAADGLPRTWLGAHVSWRSGRTGLEGAFVEPGALMLGNDFISDGVLTALNRGNQPQLANLRRQLDLLAERATWLEIDGDRCCVWKHPMEGKFQDRWGGERCAGIHHISTWQIGAAMLLLYERDRDPRWLPFIDGVYNWTKHYLFTRNGVCDLPWAMFCRVGTAAGENFLLNYRRVFRDDPQRGRNDEEALELALTSLYKVTWFFLTDPDPGDDYDPTFLNQAVNDKRWVGRVTWNECGWVLRSMVPIYCETGDPFLRYILRGALERYWAGYREDGGVAENLQIFGEIEPKGLRTAGFDDACHAGMVRRWARPLRPATLRVAMGQQAAFACCLDTTDYDVTEYRFRAPGHFGFRLASFSGNREPIDLVATAPFRDLRGLAVKVNGEPLPADRFEFNDATDGEDVYLVGVRPGDVVTLGDPGDAPVLEPQPIPTRGAPAEQQAAVGLLPLDLGAACNLVLPRTWWAEPSYAGLVPGLLQTDGIPFLIADPDLHGGRMAVGPGGVVEINRPVMGVLLTCVAPREQAGAEPAGLVRVETEDGVTTMGTAPVRWTLCNGFPLRRWGVHCAYYRIGGPKAIRTLRVEQGAIIAVTLALDEASAQRLGLAMRAALVDSQEGTPVFAQARQAGDGHPWASELPYRLTLEASVEGFERQIIRVPLALDQLLEQIGEKELNRQADLQLRAVKIDAQGRVLAELPAQLDWIPGQPRGELLILWPGWVESAITKRIDVYFGEGEAGPVRSAVQVDLTPDRLRMNSGAGGAALEFLLSGEGPGPRLADLRFDRDGDGDFVQEANVLGSSGWHGGGGLITTCTDYFAWYDNGGLQSTSARAEVVSAGPVATTVRISPLELWGRDPEGQGPYVASYQGEALHARRVGEAGWYFRLFAGQPVVEQWVETRLDTVATGWTRPLQVRYGLSRWQPSRQGETAGLAWAEAGELGVGVVPRDASRRPVQVEFSPDGNVLQVTLGRLLKQRQPEYFDRWVCLAPVGPVRRVGPVVIRSVERLVNGRIESPRPTPLAALPFTTAPMAAMPAPAPAVPALGALNPDPGLEERKRYWVMGGTFMGDLTRDLSHTGYWAADLSCRRDQIALLSQSVQGAALTPLQPNRTYTVTFWACCLEGPGELQVNFYAGTGYDFLHVHAQVPADGQWHPISVDVPTGAFRADDPDHRIFKVGIVHPALRIWSFETDQVVFVDEVVVQPPR